MMNIQKKSLQHISDVLNSCSTYNIYEALSRTLDACNIEPEKKKTILGEYGAFNQALADEKKKIKEAKGWVDSILEDLK